MELLADLQASALAQWLRISLLGVPTLMALHSVGMAIAAGLALIITLRLSWRRVTFRVELIQTFLTVSIWGFSLNFVTGLGIFITRGPDYIGSGLFVFKMLLVIVSVVSLTLLRHRVREAGNADPSSSETVGARAIALTSTISLFAAVVAGRLLAYLSDLY